MKGAKGCDSVVAQVQRLDLWHPHSAKGFYTLDLIVTDAQVDQLAQLDILDVPQYGRAVVIDCVLTDLLRSRILAFHYRMRGQTSASFF